MADVPVSDNQQVSGGQLAELVDRVNAGGAAIQEIQAAYDAVGWRIQEPTWAKARHLLYHVLSSTTELALLVEGVEHAEERGETTSSEEFNEVLREHSRVCATLLFHAAQIANMADVNLEANSCACITTTRSASRLIQVSPDSI